MMRTMRTGSGGRCATLAALFGLAGLAGLSMGGGCMSPIDPQARDTFLARLGSTSITVFPGSFRRGAESSFDPDDAAALAAMLNDAQLAVARTTDAQAPIAGPGHMDQSRMFRESAAAFGAYVREHPIDTDYALMAEYLMGHSEAGGIHMYVVDREGRLAWGLLLNSHHAGFAADKPKSVADATKLLAQVAREELQRSREKIGTP